MYKFSHLYKYRWDEREKNGPIGLNPQEIKLIDQLRQQPRIMERVQRILEIAQSGEGPLKTADEVEERLIQEMRPLGNPTMNEWATQAQERVSQELQTEDPTVLKRKKNVSLVVCLWGGGGGRTDLAQPRQKLPAPFTPTIGRESTRQIPPPATG